MRKTIGVALVAIALMAISVAAAFASAESRTYTLEGGTCFLTVHTHSTIATGPAQRDTHNPGRTYTVITDLADCHPEPEVEAPAARVMEAVAGRQACEYTIETIRLPEENAIARVLGRWNCS